MNDQVASDGTGRHSHLPSDCRTRGGWNLMLSDRRKFLKMLGVGALAFAEPYQRAAAALRNKIKITDVKCMIVRGTWDWNLVKIETDSGPVSYTHLTLPTIYSV